MGQHNLLSLLVLVLGAGDIGSTLLLLLAASGVGRIMVVDHDNVEVSNLYQKVIHTNGRRGTIKIRSAHNVMRDLKPTVLVTAVTEPLTWDNTMELVRGNDCVVDAINNPCTRYLINNACVLEEKETKTMAMTNGISGSGRGPILSRTDT